MPTLRIKRFKKSEPEGSDVEANNANLETDQEEVVATQPSIEDLLASNRKLARLSFYGIAFSLFLALCFSWMAGYYALALDAKISEQKTEFIRELDQRFRSYGITDNPTDRIPKELEIPATAAVMGDANSPVTVVEFADFQCPFCERYFTDVLEKLEKQYVDTGKVKYLYASFAFLGDESKQAANAAKCAGEQGKFWEYHNALYQNQKGENQGAFTKKTLLALGKNVGVETTSFTKCVEDGAYLQEVEAETLAGRRSGVTGTPTVFVNGVMIVGAQDYTVFADAIETALSK